MGEKKYFDIIVIGSGSMGSATCWQLGLKGLSVLGIDQHHPPHDFGSHSGYSRLNRKAYFEHPDYVPLLNSAYKLWEGIMAESGKSLYFETGIAYFGAPESPVLNGVRHSATLHQIDIYEYDATQVKEVYPALELPDDYVGIFESEAGVLLPDQAIESLISLGKQSGIVFHWNELVIGWKKLGNILEVRTNRQNYTCDKLILTAGAGSSLLFPTISHNLKVTRQVQAWGSPRNVPMSKLSSIPCWCIDDRDYGLYYGFPDLGEVQCNGPAGIKFGNHTPGPEIQVDAPLTVKELEILNYGKAKFLNKIVDQITNYQPCLYTTTPDEKFIVDFLPGYAKKVLIAAGFSGHGFKFAPVVGQILSDLAMDGTTIHPVDFLTIERFYRD